ncbi:hypothetical protein ES705_31521 [subsurface metagenome]
MCRKWLARTLRRILPFKPRLRKVESLAELSELAEKPVLREKRLARLVRTSRGGPNMPKYQPCPQCHGGAKRREKSDTLSGALYFCRRHQVSFFVRA